MAIAPQLCSRRLSCSPLAGSTAQAGNERAPIRSAIDEPLSERELEVLRLLGTDLNGPEIARELMVSLNTLRTHTKNIYASSA